MNKSKYALLLLSIICFYCSNPEVKEVKESKAEPITFDLAKDLLLVQYDFKTDVDDLHSVAAFATLISNPKFAAMNYHAVAGTYGTQNGLYVPPNDLCQLAFGEKWSDAHEDFDHAVEKVKSIALKTINNGGDIWIADGGQSDFSAALVKAIQKAQPSFDTKTNIHIVQHSNWNEEVTSPASLDFVKNNTDYQKIPDGNALGNGTPGFRSDRNFNLEDFIEDEPLLAIWEMALKLGNQYNGQEDRYLNESVQAGGLDFSDFSEVCWILGFLDIKDSEAFLKGFQKL